MSAAFPQARGLTELLQGLLPPPAQRDWPITAVATDSRQVLPGTLFLALPGEQHQGAEFLSQAIAAGATVLIWPAEASLSAELQQQLQQPELCALPVPTAGIRALAGELISRFYAEPSRHLRLVGITGTDGKTSVANFIAQALDRPEAPCGLIGTLGNGTVQQLQREGIRQGSMTTPDLLFLHRQLAAFRDDGVEQVVMEVSSHGLDQQRVAGVHFDVAVLTNLGRDHLDYHGDLAAYREAKRRLFQLPVVERIVVNLEDAFGRELMENRAPTVQAIGYGTERAAQIEDALWADRLQFDRDGLGLQLHWQGEVCRLQARLLGAFNVSNLLAAVATLLQLGFSLSQAAQRLAGVKPVIGRMEPFTASGQPLVVVDYAHTPQALESALLALRRHCSGRLHCLFGCGGDRDAGKRPLMGEVAERLADRVVVADDNPRSESPAAIMAQIRAGMQQPERAEWQHDRGRAIAQLLGEADAADVVLIAGKGHENYQLIAGERRDFSDRAAVEHWLRDESID